MKPVKIIDIAAFNRYIEARRDYRRYMKISPQAEVAEAKRKVVDMWHAKAFPDVGQTLLAKALETASGRAQKHTYSADEIADRLERVELDLRKRGAVLKRLPGASATLISEVPTAKSYARKARQAIASLVRAERRTTGWFVTSVERTERWTGPGGEEAVHVSINEATRDDIIKAALDGLTVAKPVKPAAEPAIDWTA